MKEPSPPAVPTTSGQTQRFVAAKKAFAKWRVMVLAMVVAPILGIGLFQGAVAWLPYPTHWRPPYAATLVLDREGTPLGAYASSEGQWHFPLAKEQISEHLLDAMVAVEDARFRQHGGVDWKSAAAAVWEDAASLRLKRGASTITMQLHRLRSGTPRSLWGKLDQAIRACQIERRMSKDEILVEYLNRAPFGGNLVGAGAASWRYFGKACSLLSVSEAALLAGLPQSPNRYRPDRHPNAARARRNHVLDRMLAAGMITPQQHTLALAEPIAASWHPLPQLAGDLPHANGLEPTLLNVQNFRRGQTVRTTIDWRTQRQVALATHSALLRLSPSGINSAAVVVLDTPSAQCLALVSMGGERSELDLTRCPRSTGSTLKPFIYAAAFENALVTPNSTVEDSPKAFPGYQPDNFDHGWRGKMPAGEALAQSRNIPAIVLLSKLGEQYAASIMQSAGLKGLARTPGRYGVSLAIGGAEATPLELAVAYATLARGGTFREAVLVADSQPRQDAPAAIPCLADWACWQTLEACSKPERTESISAAAAQAHVAWKTGTSSGSRDAWCAAVTQQYTVVVWMGNVDGRGADALVGVDAAAPLALQVIASLDKAAAPWPITNRPAGQLAAGATRQPRAGVTMVSPADGQEIIPSGEARSLEQIPLEAHLAGPITGEAKLWWFVDGELLGTARDGESLWWTPRAGAHRIMATTAQGQSAAARVYVR